MDDELNNKISQIIGMIGRDKMPDGVAGLISSFMDSSGKSGTSGNTGNQSGSGSPVSSEEESDSRSKDDTMRLVKTMIDGLGSTDDYRIKLLSTIKPLLGKRRQDKVNSCIQILKLAKISKTVFSSEVENGEGM